eukprot:CAMPEP_0203913724 /NCGR_PEP_ID=MMETSP0359-20131031/54695_1 /ASSEMBLY_ACC=CAM_ASM_000338 /TAXON_ID=268821 /ORGANISM="Scrippsiella Hangoei, Strain SHTV-5" /LENGTH=212 /DNA_ID=CAMNT_0050839917 /DNA_START=9 /DNA_END=643 /DNA_ORIENTATION=+
MSNDEVHGMGGLMRMVSRQRDRLDHLSEEVAALRECLESSGSLQRQAFLVHLHRRAFHAALRRHPCDLHCTLLEVLQTNMLDLCMGQFAGFAAIHQLRGASRGVGQAAARVLPAMGPALQVVYLLGGWDGTQTCSCAERFNPLLGSWEQLPPMLEQRCSAAAAVCGGEVYVLGGDEGTRPMDSAERFNVATGSWEALPPMFERRQAAAAVAA